MAALTKIRIKNQMGYRQPWRAEYCFMNFSMGAAEFFLLPGHDECFAGSEKTTPLKLSFVDFRVGTHPPANATSLQPKSP